MLKIRGASVDDLETLVRFQMEMAKETENLALDPPTVKLGVRAVIEDSRKGEYLLAEQGGRVVGSLLLVPEWSDWRNGTVLWIHSLYVIPEARGQGVYRTLYRTLQERIKTDPGLRGLRLYVDRTNAHAQRVYEKHGMSRDHYYLYEWMK